MMSISECASLFHGQRRDPGQAEGVKDTSLLPGYPPRPEEYAIVLERLLDTDAFRKVQGTLEGDKWIEPSPARKRIKRVGSLAKSQKVAYFLQK